MALTIVVRSVESDSPPQITFDSPRVVIGRGDGCEVRLPDPSVSLRHASIRQRGGDYIVVDEGSTNGTFVGPVRLSPQAPRVLKHGDRIRVGRVWLEVRLEQAPPTANTPAATKELALALVARALASAGEPSALRVVVADGAAAGQKIELADFERPYVIGRSPDVDLPLDDPDLSRRHVELVRRGEQLLVRDLGSKNGTRLGEVVVGQKLAAWPRDQSLVIGAHRLTYDDPVRDALEELERAADEQVGEGEVIEEPPSDDPGPEPLGSVENEVPAAASQRSAPVAPAPRRSDRSAPATGWTVTDVLVALLAVTVMALSIAGLVWLMAY